MPPPDEGKVVHARVEDPQEEEARQEAAAEEVVVEEQVVTTEEISLQPGSQYILVETDTAGIPVSANTIRLDVVQTADGVGKETNTPLEGEGSVAKQ